MKNQRFHYFMRRVRNPGWSVDYHTHDVYELVYYLSGKGTATLGSEDYSYSDRTFLLIPPGVPHKESAKTETELCCLAFRALPSDEIQASAGLVTDEGGLLPPVFEEIETELRFREMRYEEMLENLVLRTVIVTSRVISRYHLKEPIKSNSTLAPALAYICNYYNTDINLEKLAQTVGYSYGRFRHLFKECYGYSPKQFILCQRIAQAQVLLRMSDTPISVIASQVGFRSVSQLNESFLKFTLTTPSDYKRKYKT